MLALYGHYRETKLPCPGREKEIERQVFVTDIAIASREDGLLHINGYAKNRSPRSLIGIVVEATFSDGRVLRTNAENNEPGAPSLRDAPILPGATRAIQLQFPVVNNPNSNPKLRIVQCLCG